jgi:hypothetical protein
MWRATTRHVGPVNAGVPELPGWPGYRTRPGRSGYDPIDTNLEWAFQQGLFIKRLLTGQLRPHQPTYRALMLIFGALFPLALLFLRETVIHWGDQANVVHAYSGALMAVCSGGLLVNFGLSVWGGRRILTKRAARRPQRRRA